MYIFYKINISFTQNNDLLKGHKVKVGKFLLFGLFCHLKNQIKYGPREMQQKSKNGLYRPYIIC